MPDPGFQLFELCAGLEAPPELALREGTIVGMDEIEGVQPGKVRGRIPEDPLPRWTGIAQLSAGRDYGHDVEGVLDERPEVESRFASSSRPGAGP